MGRKSPYDEQKHRVNVLETDAIERNRAIERIQRFNKLNETLLYPGTLSEKLDHITSSIIDIFNASIARIWIIRPGDNCHTGCYHADVTAGPHACRFKDRCLHLVSSSGYYTHINGIVHRRVPFGCYKIGRIAAEKEKSRRYSRAADGFCSR